MTDIRELAEIGVASRRSGERVSRPRPRRRIKLRHLDIYPLRLNPWATRSLGGGGMFLEKHSRFFRQYDLRFSPRNKRAALLPIDASDENYSVRDAIETHMKGEKALSVQPNGDIIELVDIKNDKNLDVVVLLFHRASPNAADPMYRKKALEDSRKK